MVVTVGGQTYNLMVRPGENMLDAALDRNVDLDYSCKEGSCDTCMVRILKGMEYLNDITPQERDMLDEDQLKEGYRLSCMVIVKGPGPVEFVQEER
nr:ferredoxin [Bacillota bacterium]